MDDWNPAPAPTNAAARTYRWRAPSSLSHMANVARSEPENIFSIRYLHRDQRRRDTGYYPDTPLSMGHPLMKHKPRRPDGSQAKTLPQVGALGWQNISNTNAAMGMKGEARGGARYT